MVMAFFFLEAWCHWVHSELEKTMLGSGIVAAGNDSNLQCSFG